MRFLSAEWVAALDQAAAGWSPPDGLEATIDQVVTDAPDGAGDALAYHFLFAGGRLRVRPGRSGAADVTITQPYDVAVTLSRGEANAQQALAERQLRVSGDLGLLARHARAFAALQDVFSSVRDRKEY